MIESEKYFNIELNRTQKKSFEHLVDFIDDKIQKVFILKGYAGTGKTTLIGGLIKYLDEIKHPFSILASTGRAAKIASNISKSQATTVHSLIYIFNNLDEDLEKIDSMQKDLAVDDKGQIRLMFELKYIDSEITKVYVIDESSMIADTPDHNTSFAKFGSGQLLNDLFNYDKSGKFIFIGDPCQLPPINQKESPALSAEYLRTRYSFMVVESELTEIVRQKTESGISIVSSNLRSLYFNNPKIKWAKFPAKVNRDIIIHNSHINLVNKYVSNLMNGELKHNTLICQTNRHCSDLNKIIRSMLGRPTTRIHKGDLMMVTQNNYLTPLVNGDQIVVKKVGDHEHRCGLSFLQVVVEELFSGKEYSVLLIEDILDSSKTNLNDKQHKDLMIDYYRRMKSKGINQKDRKFREEMLSDPYLNALRGVYGYAITCHKSQGGEWDNIFLYLDNKIHGIPKPSIYQWWYTAVTRAKNELHLVDDWFIN